LWLGAREGVYFTHDLGKTWMWVRPVSVERRGRPYYDAASEQVLASSRTSDQVYCHRSQDAGWKWWQTGYALRWCARRVERLLAASLYDGVLVEPQAAQQRKVTGQAGNRESQGPQTREFVSVS
jgi:photosystem II stability/assembly factor-like uncharacterized protein